MARVGFLPENGLFTGDTASRSAFICIPPSDEFRKQLPAFVL
jgi:hypothetical protein